MKVEFKTVANRSEEEVIEFVSKGIQHEYIHKLIWKQVRNNPIIPEEKVIFSMTGDKWTKRIEKMYEQIYSRGIE